MTLDTPFDLDGYMERIGYDGDQRADASTLTAVHRRHAMTFPFENINPLMGWPVPLDKAALQDKMIRQGRGGYCFEQNLLLQHALEALGFSVKGLAARVLSNRPPDSRPPRTHMLLLVDCDDGSYIADAGFGGMTLVEPIAFAPGQTWRTSHEARRILPDGDEFTMQAMVRDEWNTLYRFPLTPQFLADYELSNWWICTHPDSHFTKGLTAARPGPDGRYALRNNSFATHHLDGSTNRQTLTTGAAIKEVLADVFLLRLPADDQLDKTLHRLAQTPPEK